MIISQASDKEEQRLEPGRALPSEDYAVSALPNVLGKVNMTAFYLVAVFFIVNAVTAASGELQHLHTLRWGRSRSLYHVRS